MATWAVILSVTLRHVIEDGTLDLDISYRVQSENGENTEQGLAVYGFNPAGSPTSNRNALADAVRVGAATFGYTIPNNQVFFQDLSRA